MTLRCEEIDRAGLRAAAVAVGIRKATVALPRFGVFREINPLVLVGAMKKFQSVEKDAASILPVEGADHFIVGAGIALPLSRALTPAFKPREQYVRVNAGISVALKRAQKLSPVYKAAVFN